MRATRIGIAVAVAVTAQTTYALFVNGTSANVDFPLVVVVFAALSGGPIVGLWTGVAAGLGQDLLSGGIVGVSGLSKSLVGFAVGAVGVQFVLTGIWHRVLALVAATIVNTLCFVGVYGLIPTTGPAVMWADVPIQGIANGVAGAIAIGVIEYVPGMWNRMRRRRAAFAARRWQMN